jgi:DNA-binding response OmpR family regulator
MESIDSAQLILLAEDDEEMRRTLSGLLRAQGYRVDECSDGLALLKIFGAPGPQSHGPGYSLLISDIRMPSLSGLDILEGFHGRPGFPPVILITAFGDGETHARARESGAIAVLDKPFEVDCLLAMVGRIVGQSTRIQAALAAQRFGPSASPEMHQGLPSPSR